MRVKWIANIAIASMMLPLTVMAGQQFCGKQPIPNNAKRCPDGGIPMFIADEVKPSAAPPVAAVTSPRAAPEADDKQTSSAGAAANPDYFFGVWRTRIPGAVWTSPSGYQGYDWLHVSAGVAVGDLIIKPDGTYVWNSYGGKSGRWVRGDASYPLVLVDTVEKKRWAVGVDPKRTGGRDIVIWDGKSYSYDGRK